MASSRPLLLSLDLQVVGDHPGTTNLQGYFLGHGPVLGAGNSTFQMDHATNYQYRELQHGIAQTLGQGASDIVGQQRLLLRTESFLPVRSSGRYHIATRLLDTISAWNCLLG